MNNFTEKKKLKLFQNQHPRKYERIMSFKCLKQHEQNVYKMHVNFWEMNIILWNCKFIMRNVFRMGE